MVSEHEIDGLSTLVIVTVTSRSTLSVRVTSEPFVLDRPPAGTADQVYVHSPGNRFCGRALNCTCPNDVLGQPCSASTSIPSTGQASAPHSGTTTSSLQLTPRYDPVNR